MSAALQSLREILQAHDELGAELEREVRHDERIQHTERVNALRRRVREALQRARQVIEREGA